MSLFARIDAVAARTMAVVHADDYTLAPQKKGADVNKPAGVDPDRPVVTGVRGIYREKEAPRSEPNAYDRRTAQRPGVASSIPSIEIDPRAQPDTFVDVRPDDLLTASVDGKIYRVFKTNSDEMGRIHASVNLVG